MQEAKSPFDAARRCVHLFRAARSDIRLGSILAFLHVCDSEGVAIKQLAHLYGYSESSMSRYVHALTEADPTADLCTGRPGLLEIAVHPDDTRRRLVFLTGKGRHLKRALHALLRRHDAPRRVCDSRR